MYIHFMYKAFVSPGSVQQIMVLCLVASAYEFQWSVCVIRFKIVFVMATIFSYFETAPMNSVINCCTTITVLNILLSRGKLFAFGAPTVSFVHVSFFSFK
jgi:hypothetical protein